MLQRLLRRYARREAHRLAPYVRGRRVLDLGAGEAWVGEALRACTSAWACSVDVGAFGLARQPYVVYDGARLPFGDGAFDTSVISLALHHCADPERVLDEAVRVTGERLLVVESVYRNRRERLWLELLDGRLNRRRHGGAMNVPLGFRRPEQWRALFEARGLRIAAVEWLGSRLERLVHHPLLYVMDTARGAVSARTTAFRHLAMGAAAAAAPK
ncbi:MAG: hypothetical protein DMD76_02555 [Candidatus Rokuibacteriota bacterium]|nr:MAG: hypothetical protein DMD76_02555 [Candidatus Rokubacteria bacterium]